MDISARLRLKLLAGAAIAALTACGSNGSSPTPVSVSPPPAPPPPPPPPPSAADGQFKNRFQSNFVVGAAIGTSQIASGSADANILTTQFSSITAENLMKPEALSPTEGAYTFEEADALVAFAEANGMAVRGHALLWHRATPDYFFEGTPAEVKTRLQKYITDVVTHFKGKIYAWDVVNEAITDDGSISTAPYRNSNWYRAAGNSKDYIDWAFEAARAADPDVKLFLNDYNTELPDKRTRLLAVVKDLIDRGIPIDGVGHQQHLQMNSNIAEALKAIDDVDAMFTGLENHVTELDISVYSDPGECFESSTNCAASYGTNVPESVTRDQAQKFRDLFNGFVTRPSITSVSLWGITDDASWLNNYPVNRPNYPLLYDGDRNIKSAFQAVTDPDYVI
jgi:endo-1,4-beta-xylanase